MRVLDGLRMRLILVVPMILAGALGGLFSVRLPASGKAAVALGMMPLLGAWLTTEFC